MILDALEWFVRVVLRLRLVGIALAVVLAVALTAIAVNVVKGVREGLRRDRG